MSCLTSQNLIVRHLRTMAGCGKRGAVSSANGEFNTDLGFSSSLEQTREWVVPMLGQLPPIAARNAEETGTDIVGYLTENFGFSVFVLDDGDGYHTYSAGGRRG